MTRILVVDDDVSVRDLVKVTLGREGHEIIESADGDSAYEVAISEAPDIILLDVMMPGSDGFQVLRELKANAKTTLIPVIMLTGLREPKYEDHGIGLGAADYLTKPFSPAELGDRVRMVESYLEIHPSSATNASATPPATEQGRPEGRARMTKILVADDDDSVRELVKTALGKEGHEIIESDDGVSTYDMAVSEHPDIILLDVMMPGMDGFQTLRELKANAATSLIPVIMVTVRRTPKDEQLGMRLGAVDYITKPFSQAELADRVRMVESYLQGQSGA